MTESQHRQREDEKVMACDHNGFAHRLFPNIAIGKGTEMLDLLVQSAQSRSSELASAFELVEALYPREQGNAVLFMKDIVVSEEAVEGRRLVVLSLTPATEPIGVHCIGLLARPVSSTGVEPPVRYLTFEREGGSEEESAVLCEWACVGAEDLVHRHLGLRGPPTKGAFLEAVFAMLAFGC